jgi:hypothetical protein
MYFQVVQIWHILLLSFVTGIAQSFGGPAYQSLIPSLVDKKDLPNAVALNSIQIQRRARDRTDAVQPHPRRRSRKAGYSDPQAMNACFALNALSFVVVINTLMMLRVKHIPPAKSGPDAGELKSGLFVRAPSTPACRADRASPRRPRSWASRLLTFLPIFAKNIFHEGANTSPTWMVFSGAGSIVGALIVAWLGKFTKMG